MKPEKDLLKQLAKQAIVTTGINGGVAQSNFEISKTSEGLLLRLMTPSLADDSYHIRVEKGNLMLFTMYKGVMVNRNLEADEDSNAIQPTFVHNYPLSSKIDQDRIEAIFDNGELRIYLPFHGDDMNPRDIHIQRYN